MFLNEYDDLPLTVSILLLFNRAKVQKLKSSYYILRRFLICLASAIMVAE
jgi:hypothetical protein